MEELKVSGIYKITIIFEAADKWKLLKKELILTL